MDQTDCAEVPVCQSWFWVLVLGVNPRTSKGCFAKDVSLPRVSGLVGKSTLDFPSKFSHGPIMGLKILGLSGKFSLKPIH